MARWGRLRNILGRGFLVCVSIVPKRVATSGKLNVVLGEKGLAERVVNLL